MAVSFSAREGATQFSVPDGCLAHLVSDLFRLDYSRTEWNVDLIRHAKSTGATKSLKLLVTTIPVLAKVIHRFANVYKHFRLGHHARKMHLRLLSAAMFGVALSQSSLGWQLPFNTPHRLLRPYLQPNSDYSAGHRGIDLEAAIGETVYAPADGQVKFIGKIVNRGVVTLMHAGDLVSELEPVCSTLKPGALVRRGEAIGQICQPDESYRPHVPDLISLHFSVRVSGSYLSPQKFVGGLNPSKLLPYALG